MGRPRSGLDDYLEWQQRLESFRESGLSVEVFCLQQGVSKSTFFRWAKQLREGIPEPLMAEEEAGKEAESGDAVFMPITLKASPVEIELPNGGVVRLPLGVGQAVLVEVIRAVGALRPWRSPQS
jgi:transposase-like protein